MNIGYSEDLIKRALNARVDNDCTVSDYLRGLLLTLWVKGPLFDAKRPYGDSRWQSDVYKAIIVAGVIDGSLDEDGFIEQIDDEAASKLVQQCIAFVFAERRR